MLPLKQPSLKDTAAVRLLSKKHSWKCILPAFLSAGSKISPKPFGGTKVSPGTISTLNKKAYEHIEHRRNRPLTDDYPYVYVDGVFLKRCRGEEYENISIPVAIGVSGDGYREIIGAAEGLKEDLDSRKNFFVRLKKRGLKDPRLIIGDKALGMVEAIGQVFPHAKYQRCIVHFYRNVFSVTPNKKVKEAAKMLKAIHAREDKVAALEKAKAVEAKLRAMKLSKAADKVRDSIHETLTYMNFPEEHRMRIRTNNTLERINREIKRRTKVVGTFPDGESALMPVCARLRHVAGSNWGSKRYLNMEHLTSMILSEEESIVVG